jgi:hypothetical protein
MKLRPFLFCIGGLALAAAGYFAGQFSQDIPQARASLDAPLIGIASLTSETYVVAIREAGGIPIVFPNADGSTEEISEYLQLVDGLFV